ncbi:MAG: SDR family NAD(P)-dependent oxidoreductase, partial [Nitrospiria bacterium]
MMSHLKDQVAIVTGGSSGIGLAIAAALVAEGMAVVIAARDKKKLQRAAKQLGSGGEKIIAITTDVSVSGQVEAMVKQAVEAYGRVDLLVNNAGIGQWGPITECSETEWDRVQAINLK